MTTGGIIPRMWRLRKSDIAGRVSRCDRSRREASLKLPVLESDDVRDAHAKRRRPRSKVCLNKMSTSGVWQGKGN